MVGKLLEGLLSGVIYFLIIEADRIPEVKSAMGVFRARIITTAAIGKFSVAIKRHSPGKHKKKGGKPIRFTAL